MPTFIPPQTLSKEEMHIAPQTGPQTVFLASPADIAIYGGAAGGGKTWSILMEPLRHVGNGGFGAVFFRRTFPMITNIGGMWDESMLIYPYADGVPTRSYLTWQFPSGCRFTFNHMQHEETKTDWQGAQIPYIAFDELTHFTEGQFFYMMSRNRSMAGIRPYMRGATNPDANSWVKTLVLPWVDIEVPIEQRPHSGELLYFLRENGVIKWVEPGTYVLINGNKVYAKSFTFVRASVFDNQKLLAANPEYLANLYAMPLVDQERLLYGNWDIVESGNMFKETWFPKVNSQDLPVRFARIVRHWDLASSKPSEVEKNKQDPDWTAGALLGVTKQGEYAFLDLVMIRDTPEAVEAKMKETAANDALLYGKHVEISYEEEPGSSGVFLTHHLKSVTFKGYRFTALKATGSKIARAKPLSAEAQSGSISVLVRPWNAQFFALASAFPTKGVHDDPIDALSGAYNMLNAPLSDDMYTPIALGVKGWGAQSSPGASSQYSSGNGTSSPVSSPGSNGGAGVKSNYDPERIKYLRARAAGGGVQIARARTFNDARVVLGDKNYLRALADSKRHQEQTAALDKRHRGGD